MFGKILERPSAHADGRLDWADLVRSIAVFGVVVVHACGFILADVEVNSIGNWLGVNFLNSVAISSVPLFVMLSGALLLKVNDKGSLYGVAVRVQKVGIPLLVWSVFYLWYVAYHTGTEVAVLDVFSKTAMYHLWYVYMIVGVYLLLPILQAIFNGFRGRFDLQLYFILLWMLLTSLPLYRIIPIFGLLQQSSLLGYGGYFLLGAWLLHLPIRRDIRLFFGFSYCAAIAAMLWLTWSATREAGTLVSTAYGYFSPSVIFSSTAAFFFLSRFTTPTVLKSVLRVVSDLSFLVFLVHVIVLEQVHLRIRSFEWGLPAIVHAFVVACVTFFISLLLARVIRLLPGARRVLG